MKAFYDVETTGLIVKDLPPEHEKQPRLVQLACLLTDDAGNEVGLFCAIIKPDGFTIPDGMVHGISNERALHTGISLKSAMILFAQFAFVADELIAYNDSYDKAILTGEWRRLKLSPETPFQKRATFCMMRAMTPIVNLPPKFSGAGPAWPKLQAAYSFAHGKEFEDAHDALSDTRATAALYFWLKRKNSPQFPSNESPQNI